MLCQLLRTNWSDFGLADSQKTLYTKRDVSGCAWSVGFYMQTMASMPPE